MARNKANLDETEAGGDKVFEGMFKEKGFLPNNQPEPLPKLYLTDNM